MRYILIAAMLALAACTNTNGIPDGAVAWCGSFEYTGTWLKTDNEGRAIGVSDTAVVDRMTVDDVIALAEAMGCPAG